MQYFNIQVASQLSGVASATIRAWEKRYNAVIPERAENKHRLYSEKDIEKLAVLFKLTEFGQSIGKIAHLNLDQLKEVYCTLSHRPYDEKEVVTPYHDKIDHEKTLSNLYLALAAYKVDIISHELEKVTAHLTPRELTLSLVAPLFQEIKRRVKGQEFTIAQEHTLSMIVSFHLGKVIGQHYQKGLSQGDLILIAAPEGEYADIETLSAALLCVHYGLRFIFLGTNLSATSLAQTANSLKSTAILLGTTPMNIEQFVNTLQEQLGHKSEIWLIGSIQFQNKINHEKGKVRFFSILEGLDEFLSQKTRPAPSSMGLQ